MKVISQANTKVDGVKGMIHDAMTNNGITGLPTQDRHIVQLDFRDLFQLPSAMSKVPQMNDFFSSKDFTRFIPETINRIVREAIEPELLVTPNLFQEIRYEGPGRSIEIGSLGAFHVAEVPEGSEYPEVEFNYGEGQMVQVGVKKHGLKIAVTEEVVDNNMFDVFGMFLRMSGKAFARHREASSIRLLNDMGGTIFDNAVPDESEYGICTGRGIDGNPNGSMTVDNLFDMYVHMQLRGFSPDTLVMNPLAWRIFMSDPETREIIIQGATLATNSQPNGSAAGAYGTTLGGYGTRTTATGNPTGDPNKVAGNSPWTTQLNPLGATFNIAPKYLPSPLKVLVTPLVNYTPAANKSDHPTTDIIMADSSRAGILLTKEGIHQDEWNDPERDIRAMKLREKWGMAILEQGKGVGIARDVVVARNYVFDNVNQATLSPTSGNYDLGL